MHLTPQPAFEALKKGPSFRGPRLGGCLFSLGSITASSMPIKLIINGAVPSKTRSTDQRSTPKNEASLMWCRMYYIVWWRIRRRASIEELARQLERQSLGKRGLSDGMDNNRDNCLPVRISTVCAGHTWCVLYA